MYIISLFFCKLVFFCYCFYYFTINHPYLHSFPTRRSSDLDEDLLVGEDRADPRQLRQGHRRVGRRDPQERERADRKSTRLNSSHVAISYDVFCLKKKHKQLFTKTHVNVQLQKQIIEQQRLK